MIPDEVIDEVRAATDIAEVIGEHLPLRPAGKRLKASCPFHTEKTPSFMVNPETQMFHCFGCGTGGNVFTFLMRQNGLTFPEAVEYLAGRVGIRLPERGARRDPSVVGVLDALEAAARLFEKNLWERQAGEEARRYLKDRGLTEETARAARLGLAMPGFDNLRNRLASDFDLNTLVKAGLLVDRDGGRPYDRFRNRLMFPIVQPGGRPVAFGARSLDAQEPKYLNSPESSVYKKRQILYGLASARRALMESGVAYIVEGYMDVLSLVQAGLAGTVAVSGTALSEEQATLLARHAKQVVLFFDGDEAGRRAARRSLPALVGAGLGVRVVLMPEGEDPDTVAQEGGAGAILGLAERGKDVVEFIVSLCEQPKQGIQEDSDPASAPEAAPQGLQNPREIALRELIELAQAVPDPVGRRLLVEETARRLRFDEAVLAREVEAGRRRQASRSSRRAAEPLIPARPGMGRHQRWDALLSLALHDSQVLDRVHDELSVEEVPEGSYRRLVTELFRRVDEGDQPSAADLTARLDDPEDRALLSDLALRHVPDECGPAAEDLIRALQMDVRRREVESLKLEIQRCERSGSGTEVDALLERMQVLLKSMRS